MDAEHEAYVALARLHADYVSLREECGKPYVQNTGEGMASIALARPRQNERLIALLSDVSKWFDGWCPNATCCAVSGKELHGRIVHALEAAK